MSLESQIIGYIGERGPMEAEDIADYFGEDPQSVTTLLRHLLDTGFLEAVGPSDQPRYQVVGKYLRRDDT